MNKVLLYWPNIVGYLRILLITYAFSKGIEDPLSFTGAYLLALSLDAADGFLARRLNQCSSFGAVLDMLCDRVSTCGLIVVLTAQYPKLISAGIFLIALDFVSHYVRMYASMMLHQGSHKDVQGNSSWLLRIYYANKLVMLVLYAAQELWYLSMYLHASSCSNWVINALLTSKPLMSNVFALFALKQWINILQLINSAQIICEKDEEKTKQLGKH